MSKSVQKFTVLDGGGAALALDKLAAQDVAHHLRVVSSSDNMRLNTHASLQEKQHQLRLPLIEPASLIVVDMNDIRNSYEFFELFRYIRPRAVFDVRVRPDFYIDVNLSSSGVTSLFRELGSHYFNMTGLLGIDDHGDPRLQPAWLGAAIADQLAQQRMGFPIVVLTARHERARELVHVLPRYLLPQSAGGATAVFHRDLLDQVRGIPSGAGVRGH